MHIESPAFEQHQPIPKKYTCEGEDVSPSLIFIDVPASSKSLALIVDDPDAPRGTFDHWIAWNIEPNVTALAEGASVPMEGQNHFNEYRYGGPCPPPGAPHRYFFKLFALDAMLKLPKGASKRQLEEAMEGHIVGKAELIGTYQRSK